MRRLRRSGLDAYWYTQPPATSRHRLDVARSDPPSDVWYSYSAVVNDCGAHNVRLYPLPYVRLA